MSGSSSTYERRFSRSSDRSVLGGVCGGLSEYFGFNLKVTRVLAVIGFLMNPPLAGLAYLTVVLLVPARPTARKPDVDPDFHRSLRARPAQTARDVKRRFLALDRRLAQLEKYVTSSRYELDREFRDLEHRR